MSTTDDSFRANVADYVDGELNEEDASQMAHHLEGCGDCAQLVRDLRIRPRN